MTDHIVPACLLKLGNKLNNYTIHRLKSHMSQKTRCKSRSGHTHHADNCIEGVFSNHIGQAYRIEIHKLLKLILSPTVMIASSSPGSSPQQLVTFSSWPATITLQYPFEVCFSNSSNACTDILKFWVEKVVSQASPKTASIRHPAANM